MLKATTKGGNTALSNTFVLLGSNLGDRVPLPACLQLGRLGSVGLQEAGQFLRVAPETLEMIMQDGPVGSDADGKALVG